MIDTVPRSRALAERWQRHPRLVDTFVALCWVLISAPSLLFAAVSPSFDSTDGTEFIAIVIVVALCLIAFRRRRPMLAFAITFVVTLPFLILSPDLPSVAAGFCIFAIAVYDSTRRAWLAAAVSAGVTVLTSVLFLFIELPIIVSPVGVTRVGTVITYAVTALLVLLVALMWGQNTGNRRRYIAGLIEHARHLERERDQQAQLAALAERSRIARDIHDIVSHSLSVIVRLSDGASAVFDREPQRAKEAVDQIGGVARSSLTEMRRVIGVLESTPGTAASQAGTGYDDLPELVDVYRGIGLPVELTVSGDAPPQSGVQVTVFRVVQEALTNALRHAHAPTIVRVNVEAGEDVTVTVHNDGAPQHPQSDEHDRVGRGLVGMRERAALYGGTLSAGSDESGQWTVHLVLPGAGR